MTSNRAIDEAKIAATGREIEEATWTLPANLRLTDLNLAAVKAQERIWATTAASPYANTSSVEFERARSVRIAEELRATLADISRRIGLAITTGEGNLDSLRADQLELKHQLAERYAVFGRYDLAAEVEPQTAYRDQYIAILEAVWRDDDVWCECEPHRAQGTSSAQFTNKVAVQDVWSIKHGVVMTLLRCNAKGCGFLNVGHLPSDLAAQRAHRATAQQVAGNLSPDEAAKELRARQHTAQRLLK